MVVEAKLDVTQAGTGRKRSRRNVTLRMRGAVASGDVHEVLIHNLSELGLLIETDAELSRGEKITVELPELPERDAQVVWSSDRLFGCEFDRPISKAAVSAAQLRSLPEKLDLTSPDRSQRSKPIMDQQSFGPRLKRLRKERGLSLVDFARRASVSRPTVWSWEAGKTLPRQSKLSVLLDVLEVSEADLLAPDTSQVPPHVETPADASRDLRSAVEEAKARVAELAGTTAEKVRLVIEI